MGASAKKSTSAISQPPGMNSRRYFWLVLGYYLCSMYIRSASGRPDSFSSESLFSNPPTIKLPEQIPGQEELDMDHHDHRGLKIAKVDFAEVETPFIIALWIFCASLAKIGKFFYPHM